MLNTSSPLKLLCQIKPNLAGSIYARSSIKNLHLVPFGQEIWPPRAILVSDWLMLKKSSPLKLLGQMEPNLAGSIYVRSSIKFLRFVPFGQQIWLPRAILVSDWLLLKISSPLKLLGQMEPNLAGSIYIMSSIKFLHFVWPTNMAAKSNSCFWLANVKQIFSETTWSNGAKLGRKHLYKVLYKVSSFSSVWPTNMAAKSNSCFRLATVKQIFSCETAWPKWSQTWQEASM